MFKILRIVILLFVLASVWGTYRMQQSIAEDWSGVVTIKVIPVIADDHLSTAKFVRSLRPKDFDEVSRYLIQSAKGYGLELSNVIQVDLEAPINSAPPSIPQAGSGRFDHIIWSLRLRWWAWNNQLSDHQDYHIRLFMLYQSPASGVSLSHSTGLRNGLIGLINARALRSNKRFHNVVLVHELLHIFGATDKYDIATGRPIYPQGYVLPNAKPYWPQPHAEIMGRARQISADSFEVAERLSQTRLTELTASEIGWLK
ncbi:MAG: hypothetical protein ACJAYF_004072 [Arenicella sp.]|jgi:hypothetical protein